MLDVKTKIAKALEALKKENKKINPSAVEKRAGVANGSLKNHPVLREIVLIEKNKYRQSKNDAALIVKNRRNTVEKKRYEELETKKQQTEIREQSVSSRDENDGRFYCAIDLGAASLSNSHTQGFIECAYNQKVMLPKGSLNISKIF